MLSHGGNRKTFEVII